MPKTLSEKSPNPSNSFTRKNGDITKKTLIECAGRLIAERGYANTTSKEICEVAKANVAAINYHFGSRDNLYLAVLEEVHSYLLDIHDIENIVDSDISAKEKILQFLDTFAQNAWHKDGWQVKVWVRELMNPSPVIYQIIGKAAFPKLVVATKIFSEYTGLSIKDPKLYSCMLNVMAPFVVVFLTKHKDIDYTKVLPMKFSEEELLANLKTFAIAGLDAFCKK